MRTRIVVADDHPLVRSAVLGLLEGDSEVEVAAEAGSFDELLEAVEHANPDMVLMDVRMPGGDALETVRKLREDHPNIAVLVLSGVPEEALAVRLMRAGATGYVEKQAPPAELKKAIHTVAAGGVYLGTAGTTALVRAAGPSRAALDHEMLSDRELQVLTLLGEGLAVGDIADRLYLSPKTVSTYRTRILKKMGLESTGEIMQYAIRSGLVD